MCFFGTLNFASTFVPDFDKDKKSIKTIKLCLKFLNAAA